MNRNGITRRSRLSAAVAASVGSAAGAEGRSDLDIVDLKAHGLREPVSGRSYTMIEVTTRSGLSGFGECPSASPEGLALARQLAVGRPATSFEVVGHQLAAQPMLRAGVDMALLDVIGRHAKAPVHRLLGGPTRNKVRAMAALAGASDGDLAASLRRARAAGHRAFLVPAPQASAPNQGQAFVRAVRRRLELLLAEAGDEANFVLDGNGGMSPGDAASLAADLERFHLLWFDEPCALGNIAAARKISSETVTPLGFGRILRDAGDFQNLLREQVVDVLRPALSSCGISGIRRIAALAETYYVAVAPRHDGGPVATAAAVHLAAAIPNFFIQQVPLPESPEDIRMRARLAGPSLEKVAGGFLELSVAPGLGVTIDRSTMESLRGGAA